MLLKKDFERGPCGAAQTNRYSSQKRLLARDRDQRALTRKGLSGPRRKVRLGTTNARVPFAFGWRAGVQAEPGYALCCRTGAVLSDMMSCGSLHFFGRFRGHGTLRRH